VIQAPDPLDTVPAVADIRSALPLTEVVSETPMVFFNEKLMVNVDDVVGTVQITVEVDTHHLAIEDLHRLLAEMETFTVSAALSDQAVASM
jgi:hypothetical protein